MKRKFLVSYWVKGETEPTNHIVEIDESITNFKLPIVLQNHLSSYETFNDKSYTSMDITILNFWEIR